jgi:hypothetical protein
MAWWWATGAGAAGGTERGGNAYRGSDCGCACSDHVHQVLDGAHDATVHGARRSKAASGRALAAAAAARASVHAHRAARCTVTVGHRERAMNVALRAVMVMRARSVRSTLPVSCSAVTRRASAIRCARDACARQAHLLETRASGGAARQVVRRPALALTWQPAFVAPPRRAGAVLGAATRRSGARGAVSSGGRKKPASCVAGVGGRWLASVDPETTADGCPPGRPSALSLQTRAAGRVNGGDGGGAARGTQRARRHAANEPLSLPHAGRLVGSRGAPLRHNARCAARAGELRCEAARGRCARRNAVALHAAQGTRARGVSSGCAADARGACSGARYAARCDAQPFTGVTRRITVRDTLLGCGARL